MNKKPVSYLQTDKRWSKKDWNGMTIGVAGCGPTSAAMLISTLTGQNVTPDVTYAWAGANGHLVKGHGTDYTSYFQKQFGQYGIVCQMLSWTNTYGKPDHPNHETVAEKLKEGYYAIALMNKGLWTTSGHFVVLWWQDGKVRINDPASTKDARVNGDIKTFRSQAKYYWLIDAREFNKEETDMTDEQVKAMIEKKLDEREAVRYDTVGEIEKELPWAAGTVKKLIRKGWLTGTGGRDENGDPTGLSLTLDMIRQFTVNDRAGIYGE